MSVFRRTTSLDALVSSLPAAMATLGTVKLHCIICVMFMPSNMPPRLWHLAVEFGHSAGFGPKVYTSHTSHSLTALNTTVFKKTVVWLIRVSSRVRPAWDDLRARGLTIVNRTLWLVRSSSLTARAAEARARSWSLLSLGCWRRFGHTSKMPWSKLHMTWGGRVGTTAPCWSWGQVSEAARPYTTLYYQHLII